MAEENSNNQTPPANDQAGQGENKDQAPLNKSQDNNLPEKFAGKSVNEIAEMYTNLERKLGEQSRDIEVSKKWSQERVLINKVLSENPELQKQFIQAVSGQKGDSKAEDKGKGGEDKITANLEKTNSSVGEIRSVTVNNIVEGFKRDFGISKLDSEEAKSMMQSITDEFADLVDPGRSKDMKQILSEVDLNSLPKYLEKAYFLANKEKLIDKGKLPQDLSSIGVMPSNSSTGKSDVVTLTEQEKKAADGLGISHEKYMERKKANS